MSDNKADIFGLDGIRMLLQLMKENDVSELSLEQGDSRMKLLRGGVAPTAAAPVQTAAPAQAPEAAPSNAEPAKPEVDDSAYIKTINSPMVGTFYAAANPDKPPFVKVGDVITPDKTVCIIEAMKVFNDIQAEISGKIVEAVAKDGQVVEYGAPLFKVDIRG